MPKAPEPPNNNEFLQWLETVDDPAERFALASEVLARQTESSSRLAAIRAAAAAATYEGSSYGQVAARLGISRSRAQQLVNEGKAAPARAAAPARVAALKNPAPSRKAGSAKAASGTAGSGKAGTAGKSDTTEAARSSEPVRTTRLRSVRKREKEK
jgi:hypothetical protein